MDDPGYVARLESADADELARVITSAAADEESTLREYLGDDRFDHMRELALRSSGVALAAAEKRGNVVVTHGIMGSSLAAKRRIGGFDPIWIDPLELVFGRLDRLRLSEDGSSGYRPEYDIRATGILKLFYGEMILSLRSNWNVYSYWFDWRKDLNTSARELEAQIDANFGNDSPVHIVAHSMGGLLARTFIKNHPERWEKMWDTESSGRSGGRLIMLGTPNHGSFAIPLLINGLGGAIGTLAMVNVWLDIPDLLRITNSFVGTYQMLPSLRVMPEMEPLYRSETYGDLDVPQRRLDNARAYHDGLSNVVDAERMVYVAGYDRWTPDGIDDFARMREAASYSQTREGDGTVPHQLGLLETPDGERVKTYFVDEEHTNLARNWQVIRAMDLLLETGTTDVLGEAIPPATGLTSEAEPETPPATQTIDAERARTLVDRAEAARADPQAEALVPEQRELEEILLHGV